MVKSEEPKKKRKNNRPEGLETKIVRAIRTEPRTVKAIVDEFGNFSGGVDVILRLWIESGE